MAHDEALVERHEDEFTRLWREVTRVGNRMTAAESTLERLDGDMYNHGRDGLKTQFVTFVAEARGAREQQKRQLNLIVALVAVATLLVMIVSVVVTVEISKRASLDPAKIFHSANPGPVLS